LRFFRLLTTRPLTVIALTAILGAGGAYLSSRLALRTSFAQLLPADDPGVKALERTQARMGDMTLLLVGVRSPDLAASERYAADLTARLRTLPRSVVEIAAYHVRDVFEFVTSNRWLYTSLADLEEARDRVRREVLRRKNPLLLDLSDDDDDHALEQRLKRSLQLEGRFPDGLFRNPGSDTVWVVALPPGGLMAENPGQALLGATRRFIEERAPRGYHPAMEVEIAGPIVTSIRTQEALQRDLTLVATVCGILIPLSIGLFFRRLRAVFFITAPAVLATVLAYAVAYLAFGYLTTVTSFLVAFVMGNGTNYAVALLNRYQQQRREGLALRVAVLEACGALWRPTGVAALASAVSYASLMITGFRGFSQFGLIGAAGCLLAWGLTFTLIPALLCQFDRRPFRLAPVGEGRGLLFRLGVGLERHPRLVLAGAGLVTLVMLGGVARFGREPFEYDFRKLSASGILDQRARDFDRDHNTLFGRWPQPNVVLADREVDVEPLRVAIRKADAELPPPAVIGDIFTVWDLLPGRLEQQRQKLAVLADIRKAVDDPALELAEAKDREALTRLRPPETLRVLYPQDLPPLARRPFTEADGTIGRVLLVYPPAQGLTLYDGRVLLRMAAVLQRIELPGGRVVESSGSSVIFGAMIRSVLKDGPIASIASLAGVWLLVLLRVRPMRLAMLVVGGLLVGVSWMIGIAGWLDVKITFLNFVALPFIFGVGVEYAIHVVSEFREHGSTRRTLGSVGGAVALCSWSAIIGYGSLLVTRNGSLRGLGAMATLGETTCLLAAIVVLPTALFLATRRRGPLVVAPADPGARADEPAAGGGEAPLVSPPPSEPVTPRPAPESAGTPGGSGP
jgi:uncharacterized protein